MMKFRVLVLLLVPLLLAGVMGCGDEPSVKPKAGKGALSSEKDKVVDKQKPIADN
jgi:hypothetical protein